MHTKISSDNPWEHNRWGFAWEYVVTGGAGHLDFGCHDGRFLNTLRGKKNGRLVGVDACKEAVEQGNQLFPDLEIVKISGDTKLPFDDCAFSSITILDVLEHIYEQKEVLAELNRVLKDGGKLVVTVPGKHLFSFLDLGNLKFLFPRLHRWYYCLKHSRQVYEFRYVSNPDGLVGDISAKKRWHEHFSRGKLKRLLEETGFVLIDFDGAGFFYRIFCNVHHFVKWIKPLSKAVCWLRGIDEKLFESTNLFCVAEKQSTI